METPSSIRRVTRSQTKTSINTIPKWRCDESEKIIASGQKNSKSDRSALIDITNDSPIVGLAAGIVETPSSYAKKKLGEQQFKQTPGTGEALLRFQVKNLLQKVVDEGTDLSKIPLEHRRFLQLSSPSGLLAPTPANTPQVLNLSGNGDMSIKFDASSASEIPFAVEEEEEPKNQQEEDMVTRSLLLDFSEKSEMTDDSSSSSPCSSVLTYQGGIICQEKSTEDDDASVWSMQVNASSTQDEDEEGEMEDVGEEEDYEDDNEEEVYEDCEEEGGLLDELCNGLSKITVQEKKMPEFEGKHTRFVYNSDDEIEGEEAVGAAGSPSVLCLKGLPVPEGKHLRFADEDEE